MIIEKEIFREVIEKLVPFNKFLGIKLDELREGFARIIVPYREEFIGDPRVMALHGGIISMAMDSVGGAAAMTTLISSEDKLSTIDIRVDYLHPGQAKDLYVESEIVRSGNRIIVTRMIAYHEDKDHLVAEGKAVYNVRRKKS